MFYDKKRKENCTTQNENNQTNPPMAHETVLASLENKSNLGTNIKFRLFQLPIPQIHVNKADGKMENYFAESAFLFLERY